MALTCMTSSGGKNRRTPGTGKIFQTVQAFLEEALAPLANNLPGQRNLVGNLVVAQAFCGQEDSLGSHDHKIRCRIFTGHIFEGGLFTPSQDDGEWAMSWHGVCNKTYAQLAASIQERNINTSSYLCHGALSRNDSIEIGSATVPVALAGVPPAS